MKRLAKCNRWGIGRQDSLKREKEVLMPELSNKIFNQECKIKQQEGHNQVQGHFFLPFKNTLHDNCVLWPQMTIARGEERHTDDSHPSSGNWPIDKNYGYNPLFLMKTTECDKQGIGII